MINASKLNRRVTVINPYTKEPDGYAGFISTPGTTKIVWAAVERIDKNGSVGAIDFGLHVSASLFMFTFRYQSVVGLTLQHKLNYMGRTFTIGKIYDPIEANVELNVLAYERST